METIIDNKSVIPLYYQLKELMKDKIKTNCWKEGDQVPSERELMASYCVSRATVRKAFEELYNEGLIYKKQGIGTFVSESKIMQNLVGELSFNQQMLKHGYKPSSELITHSLNNDLPKSVLKHFEELQERDLYKVMRVRKVDSEPLILETLYLPKIYVHHLTKEELEETALIEYLKTEHNLEFTHSVLEIEPKISDEFLSSTLKIKVGSPVLSLERVIYTANNKAIVQNRIMRGDRGSYRLMLGEGNAGTNDYILGVNYSE